MNQTPWQAPSQPTRQVTHPAPYPAAYPAPPLPAVPTRAPTSPAPLDTGEPGRASWARWAFAVAALVVTLAAIVLATLAPLGARSHATPASFGWQRLYDADLYAADARWNLSDGCRFTSQGLQSGNNDAQSQCLFTPTTAGVDTSQGFEVQATLAPAAQIAGNPVATIYADNQPLASIDQTGQYAVCQDDCTGTTTPNLSGNAIAWHGDAYVANTLTVRLTNSGQTLTVLVNGHVIARTAVTVNVKSALSLGTVAGSEEVYTHVTLYGVGKA